MPDAVVVTGIGVVSPLNPDGDKERFWSGLRAGADAVGPIRSFDASAYPFRVAAEIPRDALRGRDPDEDPAARMAEIAFRASLADAGLSAETHGSRRTGVVAGTVLGGILSGEKDLREGGGAGKRLARYPLRAVAASLAAGARFSGPILTVSTACASGTDAIGVAFRKIRSGAADAIVAGGFDALSEFSFSGFCALKALTPDKVRPFSRGRAGLALGEGAAFLVLERERAAAKRGAAVYGRVAGYASMADAVHLTAPHRDGRGLAASAAAALRDGRCAPGAVDYVSAHGTGTPYNDWMESKAVRAVLGERARSVPVSSIKAVLGHSFGAAGAMEAAACLFAIRDGIVPPTANFEEPDPECDIDCVPNAGRRVPVGAALSLSAGFGGQNAALLIREAGS